MSHKSSWIIDGYRATSNHANLWIFERSTHMLESGSFGNNVSTNQYYNRADSLFEEQIDGRGFPFALLLNTQSYSRLLERNFSYSWYGVICATTGNDDDFLDAHRWTLLFKNGAYVGTNIGFFIIGHDAYTATSI